MASWQVDADANPDAVLIRNETAVTQEDYARHAERRQNDRDMQDVPRYVTSKKEKKNDYAQQYAKERLLERLGEQQQRRIFRDLQEQDNRQKLQRPFSSRSYTPVPMGLPLTSEEWVAESAAWHEKHQEERIIDVVSPKNDKMDAYYFEGTQLYKVPRTDESYEREDRDLAASLRRNATAAAAAATAATDAWE
jgi:hypothetical protein